MKILMLLEKDFPPDGRVEYEIQELFKRGHRVDMLCITNKKTNIGEYMSGKVYRFQQSKFIYKIGALALDLPFYFNFWCRNLKQVMQENSYDVIHVHDLPLVEVALRAQKRYGVKVVADYHENRPEIMKYYPYLKLFPAKYLVSLKKWHAYQRRVSPLVDALILVTPEAKTYYCNEFDLNPDRVYVVPNYAHIPTFSAIQLKSEVIDRISNKFYVVYFGDSGIRRGTLDIIHVAYELKEYNDIYFTIIGSSSEQHILEKAVKDLHLKNIDLTGYMPFPEASSFIYGAKVGICPFHRNEHHDTTYANKMFQYMYYGLPLIVSDCPSQRVIVEKEACGVVFEAGNCASLKQVILRLYNNPEERVSMGKRGHQVVMESYNWEKSGTQIAALYNQLSSQISN